MLLVATGIALFLGYAAWRRAFIMREYRGLTAEGVTISPIDDGWWPKAPPAALIRFKVSKSNQLIHHRSYYSFADAKMRYRDWESRLRAIGVPIVQLAIEAPDGYENLKAAEDLDRYAK
jgi:hypothetical protein